MGTYQVTKTILFMYFGVTMLVVVINNIIIIIMICVDALTCVRGNHYNKTAGGDGLRKRIRKSHNQKIYQQQRRQQQTSS